MSRATRALVATFIALASPARAWMPAGAATSSCKGTDLVAASHVAAQNRAETLAFLEATLRRAPDPYRLNRKQIATLDSARSAVLAVDAELGQQCFPSLAAFRAEERRMFRDQRVYWLRVPQSRAIEAADYLGEASRLVRDVARELGRYSGVSLRADADLSTMRAVLKAADAQLGTAPVPAASLVAVAALAPAADMSHDDTAIRNLADNLTAGRALLSQARQDAARVVADLAQ